MSTTPPIPRRATSIGNTCPASCWHRDGTHSGSTAPSLKNTGRTWATRSSAAVSSPSATARNTRMSFRLLHTLGVQDHWKAQNPSKRVFLLTRSAFLGQQRVGATVWSGDVYGTYWGLTHQVPAGLNFALSGYPYWTTDIGGYWPPHDDPLADPAYQELYARWFEFGTFCPIFRTHGHRPHNEMWSLRQGRADPRELRQASLSPDAVYLLAGVEGHERGLHHPASAGHGLAHRPQDLEPRRRVHVRARNPGQPGAQSRTPPGAASTCPTPLRGTTSGLANRSRAARRSKLTRRSIACRSTCAPDRSCRWARRSNTPTQDPDGPIELRIYRGADGTFDLYEDAGDSYDYENGQHSVIPIRWDDSSSSLTIGARQGSFPGMVDHRKFRVVLVAGGHGVGWDVAAPMNTEISYEGNTVQVTIK